MGDEIWKTFLTNATPSAILALIVWFGAPFVRKTLEAQQAALQTQHEQEKEYLRKQKAEQREECRQEIASLREECRQAMTALRQEHREERQADRSIIVRLSGSVEAMHEDVVALRQERK